MGHSKTQNVPHFQLHCGSKSNIHTSLVSPVSLLQGIVDQRPISTTDLWFVVR